MTRFTLPFVIAAFAFSTTPARSQGIVSPYLPQVNPYQSHYRPGVVGAPFAVPVQQFGFAGQGILPFVNSYPGFFGFPFQGNPFWFQSPYRVVPQQAEPAPKIPNLRVSQEPNWLKIASAERSARITVQIPSEGHIWLEGQLPGETGTSRELSSPPLKPDGKYTFHIHMRWNKEGTDYEANRTVEAIAGETTKLIIFAGTPVAK